MVGWDATIGSASRPLESRSRPLVICYLYRRLFEGRTSGVAVATPTMLVRGNINGIRSREVVRRREASDPSWIYRRSIVLSV